MKARLLRDMTCNPTAEFPNRRTFGRVPTGIKPAGTVLEDPRAFRLVQMGVAEPADEECAMRANRTPEQMAAAAHAYTRTAAGIHPEDFVKYDAGEIVGYNSDGSYIPGPNAPGEILTDEECELADDDGEWEEVPA